MVNEKSARYAQPRTNSRLSLALDQLKGFWHTDIELGDRQSGSTSHTTATNADLRASSHQLGLTFGNQAVASVAGPIPSRRDQPNHRPAQPLSVQPGWAASSTNSRRSASSQLAGSRKCRFNTRATNPVGTKSSYTLPFCAGGTCPLLNRHAEPP